mgnify:CR=1 FL=1
MGALSRRPRRIVIGVIDELFAFKLRFRIVAGFVVDLALGFGSTMLAAVFGSLVDFLVFLPRLAILVQINDFCAHGSPRVMSLNFKYNTAFRR